MAGDQRLSQTTQAHVQFSTSVTSAESPPTDMSDMSTPNISETIVPPLMEGPTKSWGKGVGIQF